ncbi:MAG: hypothetical protein ABJO86_08375 [Lentilitoribacter sp.]
MSFAFAQHLEDFGQPKGFASVSMFDTSPSDAMDIQSEPEIDIDEVKSMAYQDGYNAAIAELQQQKKAAEDALRAAQAQEILALEANLGEAMAQKIAQDARHQIDENCQTISQEVGQILSHVVSSELVDQSVRQLQDLIRAAFADDEAAQIRIEGPQVLVDKMQGTLGEDFAKIDVNTNGNTELSVEIDETLMVTKLNDWRQIFGDNV